MSLKNCHILIILNQVRKTFAPKSLKSPRAWHCLGIKSGKSSSGVRSLHTSAIASSIFKNNVKEQSYADIPAYGQPLESWHYDVNTFGKLVVTSPMSIHVQPLDPQKYPTMDKVFLNVLYIGQDKLSKDELTALTKKYIVNVNLDDKNEGIDVSIQYKNKSIQTPCQCHLQIPIKYDVAVACKETGDASVENLEGEKITVRTHKGHCYMKSIKSGSVEVKTKGGGIISRSVLQGNLKLTTLGKWGISAGRLQGQSVKCETDAGDISVKAIYAQQSTFTSKSGNIHMGNCHGDAEVKVEKGNLVVDTMDGDLTGEITTGDTNIYIAREGEINIKADKGNVILKVPNTLNSEVSLVANEIQQDKVTLHNIQKSHGDDLVKVKANLTDKDISEGKIEVATADGIVELQYQDWFSTLNLNKDRK